MVRLVTMTGLGRLLFRSMLPLVVSALMFVATRLSGVVLPMPVVASRSMVVPVMVDAVTDYIARRMIEREHAMIVTPAPAAEPAAVAAPVKRRSGVWTFAFGFAAGLAALFGFALVMALRQI